MPRPAEGVRTLELGEIDRLAERPAYRQIAELLRAAIDAGRFQPGDRLPSESALIDYFRVARMTVRQAVQELRRDGLVWAEQGRGVFVKPRLEQSAGPLSLDDVVALAAVIEGCTGHSLSPNQSSALKSAYQNAQSERGGATLQAISQYLRVPRTAS